ncbi:hypothetical protein P152DRAFT_263879 [Eremomyces bilateralis CBS 781.70]|uniref:RING-type domain-containing protein n=1 Tax=Eremomyces bilateralis CBS 781.70 TaxID=1392243 RepID=A0A6G1G852_9PEZI|nr:uncharacterized protein P152DRAFT_263879 [Eremomyces bilateralis CBS 781.70]KAF1814203.1 hypothetical protein P152DRAFT_263879 [Eremomyces bilateralis CBS 781.70]
MSVSNNPEPSVYNFTQWPSIPSMPSASVGLAPQVAMGALVGLAFLIVVILIAAYASRIRDNPVKVRERLLKKRLRQLDRAARPELFEDWYKHERKSHPELSKVDLEDQVCVICLEPIESSQLIRALSCRHLYHRACFDHWFKGFHDFCPLCHRNVLPWLKTNGESSTATRRATSHEGRRTSPAGSTIDNAAGPTGHISPVSIGHDAPQSISHDRSGSIYHGAPQSIGHDALESTGHILSRSSLSRILRLVGWSRVLHHTTGSHG